MKAMLFSAGLGTRLRPLTNDKPKALVQINGTTLLENSIKRLLRYGFTDIVVNVHHFADLVINYLEQNNHFGANITISDERHELLETGGGLQKAASFFAGESPFLIMNVDIISDINLANFYDFHCASKALVSLAVRKRHSSRYLLFDKQGKLCAWQNTKTGETKTARSSSDTLQSYAFSGIHLVNPQVFSLMTRSGRFSIIDSYLDIAQRHHIQAYDHSSGIWIDVGKPHTLAQAKQLATLF